MPAVDEHLAEEDTYEISQELLNTIKFPRDIKHLNKWLPKSQYGNSSEYGNEPLSEKKDLATKNSQPLLSIEESFANESEEAKREVDKYEAIAEIERKYGVPESRRVKKHRQIPKTTPSSVNGIPEIYNKYKAKARDIAESLQRKEEENTRKNNYNVLKAKYLKRAKEVEEIEKRDKILLHKRISNNHNVSSDAYQPILYKKRGNFHYNNRSGRNQDFDRGMNSKSEDYKAEIVSQKRYKPTKMIKYARQHRQPETSKMLDNLSIDDSDSRKARILQHAREIRDAVSINREKATGVMFRVNDSTANYSPSLPKWWG